MKYFNDQYFNGNKLKEVGAPSQGTDAANKAYVDAAMQCPAVACDTAASKQAKVGKCKDFALNNPCYIFVNLKNANSYNGKITLNINSTGAKDVYINGTVSSSSNKTLPAGTYIVCYNGQYHFRTDGKLIINGVSFGGSYNDLTGKPVRYVPVEIAETMTLVSSTQANYSYNCTTTPEELYDIIAAGNKPLFYLTKNSKFVTPLICTSSSSYSITTGEQDEKVLAMDVYFAWPFNPTQTFRKLRMRHSGDVAVNTTYTFEYSTEKYWKQADWNQTNSDSFDFIKNKPTLFSGRYDDLTNKPSIPTDCVQAVRLTFTLTGSNDITTATAITCDKSLSEIYDYLDDGYIVYTYINSMYFFVNAKTPDYLELMCFWDGVCYMLYNDGSDSYVWDCKITKPGFFSHTSNTTVSTSTYTYSLFESKKTQMISVSQDIALTINCLYSSDTDHYLWVKNTGSSEIDVTISSVTKGVNSVANVYLPEGGISVPAGHVCELGIIVNADGAFITSRNDLTL